MLNWDFAVLSYHSTLWLPRLNNPTYLLSHSTLLHLSKLHPSSCSVKNPKVTLDPFFSHTPHPIHQHILCLQNTLRKNPSELFGQLNKYRILPPVGFSTTILLFKRHWLENERQTRLGKIFTKHIYIYKMKVLYPEYRKFSKLINKKAKRSIL